MRPVRELESALGWTGADGRLERALIEAGLIEKDDEGYQVVGWEADQGHIWKFHQKAKKAGKASQMAHLDGAPSLASSLAPSSA